ncbi:uncharacterized protein LOC127780239 [Oryza glaberrima]|uniref:uncharacterized protein LOC127780239 n=1 Tax=Oryza glaberrima TaxID=4538 RepID=UPI00224BED0A|nr:uncharacterized protein LOC127780239 [Oryza glaberrima]
MQQHDQLVVMAASPAAPEAERLTAAGVAKEELVAAVRIQAAEVMRAAAPRRGEGQHVLLGTAGETRAAPQGLADAVDVDGLERADDERPPAGSMTTPPRRPRPVGANTALQRLQLPPPTATTRRRADDAAAVDLEWTRMEARGTPLVAGTVRVLLAVCRAAGLVLLRVESGNSRASVPRRSDWAAAAACRGGAALDGVGVGRGGKGAAPASGGEGGGQPAGGQGRPTAPGSAA